MVRLESKQIKVIGASKVFLPSVMHPETPYFVLLLEDEHQNKWAHKSVKEYKIGDTFAVESAKTKDAVAIWRIKYNLEYALSKILELLNGIKINANSKIVILPTISEPKHPYLLKNTSPELLTEVIKLLRAKGAESQNIKVAGQNVNKFGFDKIIQKSELKSVCEQYEIECVNLAEGKFVKKSFENNTLSVSEIATNPDIIINLPIVKLNDRDGIEGASKNILQLLEKPLQPGDDLKNILSSLQSMLPATLNIAQADRITKSNGFISYLGLALASFSSQNMDKTILGICMKDKSPDYLSGVDTNKIEIVGRQIKEVKYNIEAR